MLFESFNFCRPRHSKINVLQKRLESCLNLLVSWVQVKKLKYHQYIPPDQKADKERPPQMDSSYAKLLQQQQLFLQLQILNQQQQHYNYHTILPAPPKWVSSMTVRVAWKWGWLVLWELHCHPLFFPSSYKPVVISHSSFLQHSLQAVFIMTSCVLPTFSATTLVVFGWIYRARSRSNVWDWQYIPV